MLLFQYLFSATFSFLLLTTVPTKYTCRTGHIHVETSNRFKDIVGDNYQVYSEMNPTTGAVSFTGLLKSFKFEFGALDQAFNSGRVDMSQYSKFNFEGKLTNVASINFDKPGTYPAIVEGFLYMGTYKRKTSANGTVQVLANGRLETKADFSIRIEEASMKTINDLMKKKLPSMLAMDTNKLGISRDIKLNLTAQYRPRN